MKHTIVFDLDGTLARSKSPINDRMSELLGQLLEKYNVCVISGGKFEQFETQLVANLKVEHHLLEGLHLMPTCGTRYYRFDDIDQKWRKIYAEDFAEADKKKIIAAIKESAEKLGLMEKNPWGEIIEDRGSQITFSALGQEAPVEEKEDWDPDHAKKRSLRDEIAPKIPEFEVRVGGSTSVDVTKLGIDKAYGMEKLMGTLEVGKDDLLFIGDRLEEGGNDYPVKAMGIDSIAVENPAQAELVIETLVKAKRIN